MHPFPGWNKKTILVMCAPAFNCRISRSLECRVEWKVLMFILTCFYDHSPQYFRLLPNKLYFAYLLPSSYIKHYLLAIELQKDEGKRLICIFQNHFLFYNIINFSPTNHSPADLFTKLPETDNSVTQIANITDRFADMAPIFRNVHPVMVSYQQQH